MDLCIGFDLSLTSPGMCISDGVKWSLYGFAQRRREHNLKRQCGPVTLCLFAPIPRNECNEYRYEHIRHYLVDIAIQQHIGTVRRVEVIFEGYAFGAKHSAHAYKLQELGGVIKHSLWTLYPNWQYRCCAPTEWKKAVVGHARASKQDVLTYVNKRYADLSKMLDLTVSRNQEVPCPLQDLADALCITMTPPQKTKKPQKRKRASSSFLS